MRSLERFKKLSFGKLILPVFILTLAMCLQDAKTAFAAELETQGTMQRKLQRGFLNVALSPLELVNEMNKARKENSAIPNWFVGGARGVTAMAGRAIVGVYEFATFAVPLPSNYEPIIYPELPTEHLKASR